LGAYLARRGFDYETVREAVQAAWQAVHADEASTHFDELEE
jgi:SOS response regulatory protein OraA/RecX